MLTGSPTSHIYFSQRLRLHYVDWGNQDAPPMLLVHGGRDHCRNWDWVADHLRHDYHIIAPDLRGHGDSQWMVGGAYSYIDYVYDIAQLLKQTKTTPVTIIGHSMGGSISLLYSGLYPETVSKVVSIEGMNPPASILPPQDVIPPEQKLLDWMDTLRDLAGRIPRRYATLEEALQRMQTENPHLSAEQARHLTIHGSNQNEDGTFSWKFDNYIRAYTPVGLTTEDTHLLYGRISCPTALIYGTESWAGNPEEDGRAKNFKNVRVHKIEEAGHWCHHDQLDTFLEIIENFLGEDS